MNHTHRANLYYAEVRELEAFGLAMAQESTAREAVVDTYQQWVTFKLAGETYGIDVMQVQEVLRYSEFTPVPGSQEYVLGIINLRGNVVTVLDTRLRFGIEPGEVTDDSRFVVVEIDENVVGILVDSVAEVVYVKEDEIETSPNVGNEETAKFIRGVCHKNEELLILIELNRLLE